MHGVLEKFLIVRTQFPTLFFHLLAIVVEVVWVVLLRVCIEELASFCLCHLHKFWSNRSRQTTCLTKNHIPNGVGNHRPTLLAFLHLNHIHQCEVLHVLAEWSDEAWITHLWPNVCHFVEKLYKDFVGCEFLLSVLYLPLVEGNKVFLKVCHQRTHHTAWKTWLHKQRVVDTVEFWTIVTKEVIHHFFNLSSNFHVGFHIDFLHLKTCIFKHFLNCYDVSMSRTPCKRSHSGIHIVATILTNFKDACHVETRTRMRVILNNDVLLVCLDTSHNFTERIWAANTCHIL